MTAGTHETLGIYMATFFWQLSSYQYGFLILYNIIGTRLAVFLAANLHQRFDKRWTFVFSCIAFSIFWSSAVTLALLGFSPEVATWSLVLFIIGFGIFSVFSGTVLNISVMSALADIADEHERLTGRR